MSQRLPSLFNKAIKSGVRTSAQQKRTTSIRSYATHQEQDAKPSSSATPLILAGLLAVGGYVYYSNKKGTSGSKELDPSDVSGQKFQKKADQEIAKRTEDSTNIRGQSPSTIQNESKELAGHPVATKKDAYVDPSTEKKQQQASSSGLDSSLSDLKESAQEEWNKSKEEAERTVRSWEDSAQEAKNKVDAGLESAKKSVDSVADKVQATWDQVTTSADEKTQQAVSNTKDQVIAAKDQVAMDTSKHVNEAKGQLKEAYKDAQSEWDSAEQKAREKAGDIKDSLTK